MDIDALIQQILNGESPTLSEVTSENASILADRLKAEAERQFRIDPNVSLRCADEITRIGKYVDNLGITALGTMARGDALGVLHQFDDSWQMYDLAGELYHEAGDRMGWARTCIGRLLSCVEMNSVESTFQDMKIAREIFLKLGEYDKLVRLETNAAVVLNYLSEFQAAIDQCKAILEFVESHEGFDHSKFSIVYYVLGYANQGLGNMRESMTWYERSRELMAANNEKHGVAFIDLNIINLAQAQGNNRKALQLIHQTIDSVKQQFQLDSGKEMMHLIQGYLYLNRFNDAIS